MITALPVPVVPVLFRFTINQHNWKVLFTVTSVWFSFICSYWWLSWLIKKLIVLLNKLFEAKKKKPFAVVNFKRSSEDYLEPSHCNWRRSSILFILNCCISTSKLYRTLAETLLEGDISLQSKYSACSAHYLEMIFINGEQIALLESKFHFQIEDWNLSTVDSFEVTNVECIVTYASQKVTHEIRNHWRLLVSVGLILQEFFSIFRNISCALTAHLFLRNILRRFITADCFFTRKSTCD